MAGLLASSLLIVAPVYGQEGGVGEEELECTLPGSGPDEVDGENQAREEAEACGVEVEVLDERTEFGEEYALPDGSMRASSGVEPVRAVDDSGRRAPIDTTLEFAAGGTVRPVNVAVELEFSGGGDDLLALLWSDEGEPAGLTWSEELPVPVLEGDTATYDDVLPDVDLVVQALSTGYRHDLVIDDDTLTLHPDLDMLQDPATVYPVVIDPLWSGSKRDGEWATVYDKWNPKGVSATDYKSMWDYGDYIDFGF